MANFYDQFRIEQERGANVIQLGDWHDYPAGLFNTPGRSNTLLQVGCRTFLNAASARLHWRGGVSRDGGAPRPFAEALISLAEALCRIHGWPNWAEPLLPANDHAQLHNIIAQRDRTIADLRRDLNIERECIASRDQMIQRNAVAINRLNQTIRERDATVLTLHAQADHLSKDRATPASEQVDVPQSVRRELNELRRRVAELERHLPPPTMKAD